MNELNNKFKMKVVTMNQKELMNLVGTMAGIIDAELEDVARTDDYGKILPKAEQPFPYIVQMMEVLEYD